MGTSLVCHQSQTCWCGRTLYVSESMGHSQSNDVTSGYQDMYPLEIRFRNNSELLDIEENKLEEDVENMTLEQAQAFIKMMLKQ